MNKTDPKNISTTIRLTQFTKGGGCACKLRPQDLETVLDQIPVMHDTHVLVGTDNHDDAAVYKINNETALVETVDFFTPVVDNPYWFGAIAAANALSDIYAMGARALFALNIVGFPSKTLPMEVLKNILTGAQQKCKEAGIPILGGHTIDDEDPKYGLVVTGSIHPDRILTNGNARPGDLLILTKPLGTGIITSGIKKQLTPENIKNNVIRQMATLNKHASEIMLKYPVSSCTDVTGFGLLGHLSEMTHASKTEATVKYEKIPVLPYTEKLAMENVIPAGTKNNYDYTSPFVDYAENLACYQKMILNDAQTSGGLLIAIPGKHAHPLLDDLIKKNVNAHIIGEFTQTGTGKIHVR